MLVASEDGCIQGAAQGVDSTVNTTAQVKVEKKVSLPSCNSWDFPLWRGDQQRRLISVLRKEADLRDMQIREGEASVRQLCAKAARLEVAKEALASGASCKEAQKRLHGCPKQKRRWSWRMHQLLRRRKASLQEARAARAWAEESQSIAVAELCWAKAKIESLQKENAWLRIHWASAVAPSMVAGLPPPPMRPVCRTPSPRRPREWAVRT